MNDREGLGPEAVVTDLEARKDAGTGNAQPSKAALHNPQAAPSWRNVLPIHPAAELFPLMSREELLALGKDIKTNGLSSPIVIWCTGGNSRDYYLLDGRCRLDAMEMVRLPVIEAGELNVTRIEYLYGDGDMPVDPYTFVLSANVHRRHLNIYEKDELIAKLIKLQPRKSNRRIAKETGTSHPHVAKVRAKLEKTGDVETISTSIDTKGRRQPVKKGIASKTGTKTKRRDADDLKRDIAAKAAVAKPVSDKAVSEHLAPDEEIALLREFARFVIGRANVTTDPKDHAEFKSLLGRVKAVLGGEQ